MATIQEQLVMLITQKLALAANLNTMGVVASPSETLNTLVPKVLQIPQGGGTEAKLYSAANYSDYLQSISLIYSDTVYTLGDFITIQPAFCGADSGHALNYSTAIFGWDYQCFTCSTTPITITAATQIAMQFIAGSTEIGALRLVASSAGTAADILQRAQTDGQYIDLSYQWLYCADYITTLTSCGGNAGSYYLAWVGRTNNSHPLIKSIIAMA